MRTYPTFELAFTKDPDWRKERAAKWEEIIDYDFEDATDDEIDLLEGIFIDGALKEAESFRPSTALILRLFPIKTEDAWTKIIQCYEPYSRGHGSLGGFIDRLSDMAERNGWTIEEELRFWKYIGLEHFQPVIYPEALKNFEKEEERIVTLNPVNISERMISSTAWTLIKGEMSGHDRLLYRWEFFLECLFLNEYKVAMKRYEALGRNLTNKDMSRGEPRHHPIVEQARALYYL